MWNLLLLFHLIIADFKIFFPINTPCVLMWQYKSINNQYIFFIFLFTYAEHASQERTNGRAWKWYAEEDVRVYCAKEAATTGLGTRFNAMHRALHARSNAISCLTTPYPRSPRHDTAYKSYARSRATRVCVIPTRPPSPDRDDREIVVWRNLERNDSLKSVLFIWILILTNLNEL